MRALYRRRRLLLAALVLLSVLVLATGGFAAVTTAAGSDVRRGGSPAPHLAVAPQGPGDPRIVVVPAGGSIWESVVPFTPDGMSPHAWVAHVIDANDADASAVPAGAVLRLPSADERP